MSVFQVQLASLIVLGLLFAGYLAWKFYEPFRPGFVRARIVMPDRRVRRKFLRVKRSKTETDSNIETIVDRDCEYHVLHDTIYPDGWQRTPSAYYLYGCFEPINLLDMKLQSVLSGIEYHSAIDSHVAADALESLKPKGVVSAVMSMLILGGVILTGTGILYFKMNTDVKDLRTEMYAIHNVPVVGDTPQQAVTAPLQNPDSVVQFGGGN